MRQEPPTQPTYKSLLSQNTTTFSFHVLLNCNFPDFFQNLLLLMQHHKTFPLTQCRVCKKPRCEFCQRFIRGFLPLIIFDHIRRYFVCQADQRGHISFTDSNTDSLFCRFQCKHYTTPVIIPFAIVKLVIPAIGYVPSAWGVTLLSAVMIPPLTVMVDGVPAAELSIPETPAFL